MKVKLTRDDRNKSSPWVLRWSLYNPVTGKDRWRQKSFRYKAQAQQFRAELKTDTAGQRSCCAGPLTLSEFRRQWLQTRGLRLKPSTVDLYLGTLDRLEAFLGKHRIITDIGPQDAERFVASQQPLVKRGDPKPLSQATRNQIARNCRSLFAAAVRWELLRSNPFEAIDLPRLEQRRFHRLTPEEENALRMVAPTLWQKAIYDVLLTTGARMNEVLSRMWADFDFVHGTMMVSNRSDGSELPPFTVKTKRQRVIPLSPGTIDILTQLQAEAPENVPYVFLTQERYDRVKAKWHKLRSQGKPWKEHYLTNNILRDFKVHCQRAGIKPTGTLCIHTLRKNTGQTLADEGLPVNVVQVILGHSDPRTTLQYYSQVDQHHQRQVSAAFDKRRLGRDASPKNDGKEYVSGTYGATTGRIQE